MAPLFSGAEKDNCRERCDETSGKRAVRSGDHEARVEACLRTLSSYYVKKESALAKTRKITIWK